MPRYTVTYAGAYLDDAQGLLGPRLFVFHVKKTECEMRAGMVLSHIHYEIAKHNGIDDEELGKRIAVIALQELESYFRGGGKFTDELLKIPVDYDDVNNLPGTKRCAFQDRTRAGLLCAVSDPQNGRTPITTVAICDGCNIPDDRLRCTHFCHPSTVAIIDQSFSRNLFFAFCELSTEGPGADATCVPGKKCWESDLVILESAPEPPRDVAARIIDEIDFINLLMKDKKLDRLFTPSFLRGVLDIATDPDTGDEFIARVATLADLLDGMNVATSKLPLASDGRPLRSIDALEAWLMMNKYRPFNSLRKLRAVRWVRNSWPIHSRTERVIRDYQELGLELPIRHWGTAWNRVLGYVYQSLKELRQLLQQGPIDDELSPPA